MSESRTARLDLIYKAGKVLAGATFLTVVTQPLGDEQMAPCSTFGSVILDDGDFQIQLNDTEMRAFEAPGHLHRRCRISADAPQGYESIGEFAVMPTRQWSASVDAACGPAALEGTRQLGCFAARIDAILALWVGRHSARCRHQDAD